MKLAAEERVVKAKLDAEKQAKFEADAQKIKEQKEIEEKTKLEAEEKAKLEIEEKAKEEALKKADAVKETQLKAEFEKKVNTRKIVELPTKAEYQSDWKKLGITWVKEQPVDEMPFLAQALLPEDWESRKNPSGDCDRLNITLLDSNHIPRVNIFIKTAFYDLFAVANFLSIEDGKLQLQKEIEEENIKKKEEEEANITQELVLNQRSEVWSEATPFGVFFIKDLSNFVQSGYINVENSKMRSCHGYFPQETANKAKELLEKSASYKDRVWVEKVKGSDLQQVSYNGYKTTNGFLDPYWWNTRIW